MGQPKLTSMTYWIGRSLITESELNKYVEQGLLSPCSIVCAMLQAKKSATPESYEAVIFHDFFKAGLRFPCEDFVGEVLQHFNLQIHQLAPNAFAQLGVYAMAMKMSGSALSVNTFTRYYETHLHKKTVKDR